MMLSAIIPAYNEESTLGEVVGLLKKLNVEKEIIVIDDGSTDNTYNVARNLGVRVIRHEKNKGKGAAIHTGFNAAKGDTVIIQDADLEYSPEDIPALLEPIETGKADAVYGSRFMGKIERMSPHHRFGNLFLSKATQLLFGVNLTDVETGYKVVKREAIDSFNLEHEDFRFEIELTFKLIKGGYKIVEVPIKYHGRKKGEKKITWRDGVKAFLYMISLKISG